MPSLSSRCTKRRAALMGPTVCELEGPIPMVKRSKTLIDIGCDCIESRSMRHLFLSLLLALPSAAAAQDGWKTTPVEAANFEATPSYQETIEYLQELDRRMPEMQLSFYGDSPQIRAM